MKKVIFIFLITFSFLGQAQKKQIKLHVSQYTPYCGGARPPKDMEEAAKLPQPYANQTIIYKTKKGKVDSVKTNDSGMVILNLNFGTYKFYESWRYYRSLPDISLKNNYNKACMKKEWCKSLITVDVTNTSDNKLHTVEIHNLCPHQQPCAIKTYLPE